MDFDYIIVGGGSAGCVLANRLSAESAKKVLLIEAGKDYPPGSEPEDVLDSFSGAAYFNTEHLWNDLKVQLQPLPHNAPHPPPTGYEQGRVIGGSSSINGQVANRGGPIDYDAWEHSGLEGWGWDDVLPYFRKLENDHNFDGPLHGKDGPQGVRRIFPDAWAGFSHAAGEAFANEGYPYLEDQAGKYLEGYFPIAMTNVDDKRHSAAMAYLTNDVRARGNLSIHCETQLKGLIFEGRRVVGIDVVAKNGDEQTARGREIILSAGGLHSPAILMRAGIGPAAQLRNRGIEALADLPGVGQNLQDHPAVSVAAYLRRGARMQPPKRRQFFVGLRYSSKVEGTPENDMYVSVSNQVAWHPLGLRLGAMVMCLYKPASTGQVTLASADWRAEPAVEFDLLKDERDTKRLAEAVRFAARLFASPPLAACTDHPFPISYGERIRKVGKKTWLNWLRTAAFGLVLDALPGQRKRLIESVITQGFSLERLLADADALEAWVETHAAGVWHPSCTCRMGAEGDPMAVLDGACRVRDVEGLRVVDASSMPEVPRGNTNLPTMMIAEKAADAILAGS